MRFRILLLWFLSLLLIAASQLNAQQKLSIEDAVLARQKGLLPQQLNGLQWVNGTELFSLVEDNTLRVKDIKGKLKYSITLEQLNTATGGSSLSEFPAVQWIDGNRLVFQAKNAWFIYHVKEARGNLLANAIGGAENQDFHAESGRIAFTNGNNLLVASGSDHRYVTNHENNEIVAGQAIHRFEFGIAKGTFWSPDGAKLAFYEKDESAVGNYPMPDYSTYPAENRTIKYPMSGTPGEKANAGIYNSADGKTTYLEFRKELGPERYITNLTWSPDGKILFAAEVNRAQNKMHLNAYDGDNGFFQKTLFEESDSRYVEPERGPVFLPWDNSKFLWFSEREGYDHLFVYDTEGNLIRAFNPGNFPILRICGFSAKEKLVYFEATGEDARDIHVFSASTETGIVTRLSAESGQHSAEFCASGKYYLDRYSNLETPNRIRIFSASGKPVLELLNAPNPIEGKKYGTTEFHEMKAADGTVLYGRMIKPSRMEEGRKYPVIVYVYNGPHLQLVTNSWMGGAPLWMHSMAEEGYIIWSLDGRGSANRGRDFEQAVFRSMGSIELDDQLSGVAYLRSLPYVDASRMGIHGWSYGGFITTSLMLKSPGTFKAGVAGGAVTDWRLYEIMYTERYMDTPTENAEGYESADLKNYVKSLKGDLLMIHGSDDDIVVLQHAMTFLKTCVDEGVQLDYFVYPGHAHNVLGKDRVHLMKKVLGYFMEKL